METANQRPCQMEEMMTKQTASTQHGRRLISWYLRFSSALLLILFVTVLWCPLAITSWFHRMRSHVLTVVFSLSHQLCNLRKGKTPRVFLSPVTALNLTD